MEQSKSQAVVRASEYRGWSSVVLETEAIRAELIPGLGAKIVSLRYKPTGKEWLVDAGSRELLQPAYGSSFGEADLSGWDECFPTITPCDVEIGSGGKRSLPDHGEAWPLPWDCEFAGGSVACSVAGRALPYRFARTLSCPAADTLRMEYRVANLGGEPLPFLWVPHPQFAVTEPTRIVLPASVRDVACVFGGHSLRDGESYAWADQALAQPGQTGDGRKFYVPGRLSEGWSGLACERSGDWLRMDVDPERVPYFGVWIDEGMVNDRNAVAPEPSIGYYDALDRAIANGSAGIVGPGKAFEWTLELRLGAGGSHTNFDGGTL